MLPCPGLSHRFPRGVLVLTGWLLLVAGVFEARPVLARQALANTAPQMLGLQFDAFPDTEARQLLLLAARRVPVALLLPAVSSDSHFDVLFGAAGARFGNDLPTRFRWRAGLLDLDVFRPPFGAGLTLLDVDRAGVPDLHARWLAVRLGPSLRLGGPAFFVEPRFIGNGALSSLRLGQTQYDGLGPGTRDTRTALEAGYTAGLLVQLGPHLHLTASSGYQIHYGGPDPSFHRRHLGVLYAPESRLQVFAAYGYEKASLGPRTLRFEHFHAGLRFLPAAGGL
ncbi:MAG: hypothetical protein KatS3mg043_2051 [Rhodothermaceae bacterium]|nr:MAG: hypothetical protein KatS3mg043_2051 [Rhodothermaceae bacterium]